MAFEWKDLVDGEDYVTAEPINRIANEVLRMSENSGGESTNEKVLFVTIEDDMPSHNGEQIRNYVENGYNVYLRPYNDDFAVALSAVSKGIAYFSFVETEELFSSEWAVYSDGPYDAFERQLVDTNTIGDIETALDGIIAIQEALIWGDSV